MTVNEEMRVPYVSKELCMYLREAYSLPNVLHRLGANGIAKEGQAASALGVAMGINSVIERLEAINAQQEGDNA